MTSNYFLVKQKNLNPPHALLDGEEHHHLARVLRKGPGARVWLLDEQGNSYRAEVEKVERRQTRLSILEKEEASPGRFRLVLAQALVKSKNMDLIIQKATELGVEAVIPIEAARSVVRLSDNVSGKLERWRKIASEAAKQSRRSGVPVIQPPQPYSAFLNARHECRRLVLSEDGGVPLRDILAAGPAQPDRLKAAGVLVLVGPEGGWTEVEQKQAVEKGFEPVSLGSRILRSETAALAILAAISIFWGA